MRSRSTEDTSTWPPWAHAMIRARLVDGKPDSITVLGPADLARMQAHANADSQTRLPRMGRQRQLRVDGGGQPVPARTEEEEEPVALRRLLDAAVLGDGVADELAMGPRIAAKPSPAAVTSRVEPSMSENSIVRVSTAVMPAPPESARRPR